MSRIFTDINVLDDQEVRDFYDGFNAPITSFDCGKKCAPHNPNGKPFCCDICHAVPAAYRSEWRYLQPATDLWHEWRGDECGHVKNRKAERKRLLADTPHTMTLLACLGPTHCQREYRALSCRQFPFFPYVTSDYRFLGLAYEWEFEGTCWVIGNLDRVTRRYREEFIHTYDRIFALFQDEFDAYAVHSGKMRAFFSAQKRRVPLLHRNGGRYLISPISERAVRIKN